MSPCAGATGGGSPQHGTETYAGEPGSVGRNVPHWERGEAFAGPAQPRHCLQWGWHSPQAGKAPPSPGPSLPGKPYWSLLPPHVGHRECGGTLCAALGPVAWLWGRGSSVFPTSCATPCPHGPMPHSEGSVPHRFPAPGATMAVELCMSPSSPLGTSPSAPRGGG